MLLHPHGEQGFRVVLDIEQSAVVIGPDHVGRNPADAVRVDLAGVEVLEADHVLAAADIVLGPGQQAVVLADFGIADVEVVLAGGHGVDVEQDLLGIEVAGGVGLLDGGGIHAGGIATARLHRIVLARFEAAVIPPTALAIGDAGIVLLDAADDLLVQLVLQRLQRRHHLVGIGVLGVSNT